MMVPGAGAVSHERDTPVARAYHRPILHAYFREIAGLALQVSGLGLRV